MRRYIKNLLISIDQLANTILRGRPDETISSRCYRAKLAGKRWGHIACAIIDAVFRLLGDPDHCANAFEADEGPTPKS